MALLGLLCGPLGGHGAEPEEERPPMKVELQAPPFALDDRGAKQGHPFVVHPWAIRDRDAEIVVEEAGEAPPPSRNVVTKDGVEVVVTVHPEALPLGMAAGLYVGLFSFSLTGQESTVEEWLAEGNTPPPHNPLRLWTMFTSQNAGMAVAPDELGDSCVGEAFRAEFCARVTTCFPVVGGVSGGEEGGGRWRIAFPMQWASNYRVEVYLGERQEACVPDLTNRVGMHLPWWAPPIAENTVGSRSFQARHAAYTRFRLLHVDHGSAWWALRAKVEPTNSWTEMMAAAIQSAVESPAAQPTSYGLPAGRPEAPHGLWLEFGVGSGRSTAFIAQRMKFHFGGAATIHGFDSFHGLPMYWDHTKLGVGTFSTGGEIPPHLNDMANVEIHVGLFQATLGDLDKFGNTPVAFAHIDVDIYPSAVETLSRIACQLLPGSVLVFDELVNYKGFELSGEYRAWEYVSAEYGIPWNYAGLYWQQAVPVVITQRGAMCG